MTHIFGQNIPEFVKEVDDLLLIIRRRVLLDLPEICLHLFKASMEPWISIHVYLHRPRYTLLAFPEKEYFFQESSQQHVVASFTFMMMLGKVNVRQDIIGKHQLFVIGVWLVCLRMNGIGCTEHHVLRISIVELEDLMNDEHQLLLLEISYSNCPHLPRSTCTEAPSSRLSKS